MHRMRYSNLFSIHFFIDCRLKSDLLLKGKPRFNTRIGTSLASPVRLFFVNADVKRLFSWMRFCLCLRCSWSTNFLVINLAVCVNFTVTRRVDSITAKCSSLHFRQFCNLPKAFQQGFGQFQKLIDILNLTVVRLKWFLLGFIFLTFVE